MTRFAVALFALAFLAAPLAAEAQSRKPASAFSDMRNLVR